MPKNKKGPLSKVECFYIDGNKNSLEVAEIAEDLNRSIVSVENYLKKNVRSNNKKKSGITAGEQFIRQSGATIMSENASTIADSKRKIINKTPSHCTTKIKE